MGWLIAWLLKRIFAKLVGRELARAGGRQPQILTAVGMLALHLL